MTPFVAAFNAFQVFSPAKNEELASALRACRIDPEEVRVDDRGYTGDQRRMLRFAYATLADILCVDGVLVRSELDLAVSILKDLTGGQLSKEDIENELLLAPKLRDDPQKLPTDFKRVLLRAAVAAAFADSRIASAERLYLARLTSFLGLSRTELDALLFEFGDAPSRTRPTVSENIARALLILGLTVEASTTQIKTAYRNLMVRYHPDRAGFDDKRRTAFTKKAQELNWAIEQLRAWRQTAN